MKKVHVGRILLIFAATLALTVAAWAGPEDVQQAAENSDVEAQLEMGILYEYGFPASQNNVSALAWYLLAAEGGSTKAMHRRDRLISKMTPAEVGQARQQSGTLVKRQPAAIASPSEPPPTTDTN